MSNTQKIGLACFVGGAICTAVALIASPHIWWLGTLAGFAGGYLSYEFKEVLRAIPRAASAAWRGAGDTGVALWEGTAKCSRAVGSWLSLPHPFLESSIAFSLPLTAVHLSLHPVKIGVTRTTSDKELVLLFVGLWGLFTIVSVVATYLLACLGSRIGDKCFWRPFLDADDYRYDDDEQAEILQALEYVEKPLTRRNALRWTALGIWIILRFIVWTIVLRGTALFAWRLVKLIHSERRLLCAVDGAIGGTLAGLSLRGCASSPFELIAIVVFGGLLGATFGIANWEIVSKRLLRVERRA